MHVSKISEQTIRVETQLCLYKADLIVRYVVHHKAENTCIYILISPINFNQPQSFIRKKKSALTNHRLSLERTEICFNQPQAFIRKKKKSVYGIISNFMCLKESIKSIVPYKGRKTTIHFPCQLQPQAFIRKKKSALTSHRLS